MRADESEQELEQQLRSIEAEHERVRTKLQNMAQNENRGREQLALLREEHAQILALEKDVKYAELEVQFAKERVTQVSSKKRKISFLFFFFFFLKGCST